MGLGPKLSKAISTSNHNKGSIQAVNVKKYKWANAKEYNLLNRKVIRKNASSPYRYTMTLLAYRSH